MVQKLINLEEDEEIKLSTSKLFTSSIVDVYRTLNKKKFRKNYKIEKIDSGVINIPNKNSEEIRKFLSINYYLDWQLWSAGINYNNIDKYIIDVINSNKKIVLELIKEFKVTRIEYTIIKPVNRGEFKKYYKVYDFGDFKFNILFENFEDSKSKYKKPKINYGLGEYYGFNNRENYYIDAINILNECINIE